MDEYSGFVVHVTDWGLPEEAEDPYLISVDIRKRTPTGKLAHSEAKLLCHAGELINAFVATAVNSGYEVWADASRSVPDMGNWPRWASNTDQIPALIQAVAAGSSAIYPVSVWLMPGDRADAIGRLEEFRAQPFDEELYSMILEMGIVRLSLEDTYCDITSHLKLRTRVLTWMHAASKKQSTTVHWLTIPD